jgi:hypothetical protein
MFLVLAIYNIQYVEYCEARLICILPGKRILQIYPYIPAAVCGAWPVIQGTNVWLSIKIFIIYLPYS